MIDNEGFKNHNLGDYRPTSSGQYIAAQGRNLLSPNGSGIDEALDQCKNLSLTKMLVSVLVVEKY